MIMKNPNYSSPEVISRNIETREVMPIDAIVPNSIAQYIADLDVKAPPCVGIKDRDEFPSKFKEWAAKKPTNIMILEDESRGLSEITRIKAAAILAGEIDEDERLTDLLKRIFKTTELKNLFNPR